MGHLITAFSRGIKRGLIAHIRNVRTAKPRRLTGQKVHINCVINFDGTQVHFENGAPLCQVRHVDVDLAVKSPSPHQGLVQNVGTVRRSEDDHTAVRTETVHFGKELIQGVFTLIVRAHAGILAPSPSNRINFVDEDDRRSFLFGLLEEVANTRSSHPDKHFHEVRTTQGEERDLCLARNGLGEQCFSGSRRAHQKRSFRDFRSEVGVFLWGFQECDNLFQLVLRTVQSRYVFEIDVGSFSFFKELCFGFSDVENLAATTAAAAESAHQQHPHADHQGEEDDIREHLLAPLIDRFIYVSEVVGLRQVFEVLEVGIPCRNVQPIVSALVHVFQQPLFLSA